MILLWLVPTVIALAAFGVVIGLARRAVEEVQGLQADVRRLADVRGDILEMRRLVTGSSAQLTELVQHRRPNSDPNSG